MEMEAILAIHVHVHHDLHELLEDYMTSPRDLETGDEFLLCEA